MDGAGHKLHEYPCGLHAGEQLRLKTAMTIQDQEGRPTGEIHKPGEIWTVVDGSTAEPDIVWCRQPNGTSLTWDADGIFDSFERIGNS